MLRTFHGQARRGFTLIELLVVVAIIAVLASLLLVAIQSAMRKAKSGQMRSQLSNIELAANAYHQDEGFFPGLGLPPVAAGGNDVTVVQALYKALRNRATRAAGGGRSFPYHDPGQAEMGNVTAVDPTSNTPGFQVAVPVNVNAQPLGSAELPLIDDLAYQTGGAGTDNCYVDANGNYFHYREWESQTEASRTAGNARNRSRIDAWSNGPNGRDQSYQFWATLDADGNLLEDGVDGATGRLDIEAPMDDVANFDR